MLPILSLLRCFADDDEFHLHNLGLCIMITTVEFHRFQAQSEMRKNIPIHPPLPPRIDRSGKRNSERPRCSGFYSGLGNMHWIYTKPQSTRDASAGWNETEAHGQRPHAQRTTKKALTMFRIIINGAERSCPIFWDKLSIIHAIFHLIYARHLKKHENCQPNSAARVVYASQNATSYAFAFTRLCPICTDYTLQLSALLRWLSTKLCEC